MKVEAHHIGQTINVKPFLDKSSKIKVLSRDPLVLALAKKRWVIVFRYGVVVFWNVTDEERDLFLERVKPYTKGPLEVPLTEAINVKPNSTQEKIGDGTLYVGELTVPLAQVISLVIARSVVLDFFEQDAELVLSRFAPILNAFKTKGRISIRPKQLLRLAGAAMTMKNQTISQFSLLDKPDFTWDDHELDLWFLQLDEEFEITDRFEILTSKIEVLLRDSEFILNYLDGRRSLLLEVVVILLIAVEVILFIFELLGVL